MSRKTNEITLLKMEGTAGIFMLFLKHIYKGKDLIKAEYCEMLEESVNMGKSLGEELSNN